MIQHLEILRVLLVLQKPRMRYPMGTPHPGHSRLVLGPFLQDIKC